MFGNNGVEIIINLFMELSLRHYLWTPLIVKFNGKLIKTFILKNEKTSNIIKNKPIILNP